MPEDSGSSYDDSSEEDHRTEVKFVPNFDRDSNDYGYCMHDSDESDEDENATEAGKPRTSVQLKTGNKSKMGKHIERLTNVNVNEDDMIELNDVNFEEKRKFYAISLSNFVFYVI